MRKLILTFCLALAVLVGNTGTSFALTECEDSPTDDMDIAREWDDCEGTVTYPKGDKYVGEWKDAKGHGQGTFTFANGNKYVGEWKDGKYHGQGTYTFADGRKYVGEWKNNKIHGHGTFTFADGEEYVGEWKDGKRHGQGTFTFPNGRVKEGVWENGKFQYARKVSPPVRVAKPRPVKKPNIHLAGTGTGFSISDNGHLLTNHHVIKGCKLVVLHKPGKVERARVLAKDKTNDLALLKADFRPKAVFAISQKNPSLMQDIMVAGYPFGRSVSSSVKVTKGIVSSLTGIGDNYSNIQIDAAIQPGNSGGPIIDDYGNVVGVAVATLNKSFYLKERGTIPENVNFGIKASVASSFVEANNIEVPRPNTSHMTRSRKANLVTNGTHFLSCWMTKAQIRKTRSKKSLVINIDPTLLETIKGMAELN